MVTVTVRGPHPIDMLKPIPRNTAKTLGSAPSVVGAVWFGTFPQVCKCGERLIGLRRYDLAYQEANWARDSEAFFALGTHHSFFRGKVWKMNLECKKKFYGSVRRGNDGFFSLYNLITTEFQGHLCPFFLVETW